MKYLFLDTATSVMTIGIIDNNKIVYYYHEVVSNNMSSQCLPIIESAFKETNLKATDIDKIFTVTGPGSFTGVRIGVTIAKTMAWALNIPVIPISSLEVLSSTDCLTPNVVAIIDARRDYYFAGVYDNDLNSKLNDCYIHKKDLKDFLNQKKYTLISYDDIKDKIEPKIDILKVIAKHETDMPVNPHNLNPNYLKKTEAEMKLVE